MTGRWIEQGEALVAVPRGYAEALEAFVNEPPDRRYAAGAFEHGCQDLPEQYRDQE